MEEVFLFELPKPEPQEIEVGVEPTISNYEEMIQEILFLDNRP